MNLIFKLQTTPRNSPRPLAGRRRVAGMHGAIADGCVAP
jgi:hypothetical protein